MKTYCRICEAACGLELEFDAAGQPVALRPDKAHPVSQGFACAKGTRFLETARHPKRILYPMRRERGGVLQRVSWNAALEETGQKLRDIIATHGPHAVGVYFGNPSAFNAVGSLALVGLMKALGTRNVYSAGSQDCNNKFAAANIVHGSPVIHPLPDFENAELAVLFGSNPAISQGSFVHLEGGSRLFDKLASKGAQIVWVDPRKSESAKRWGEHLPIHPGTDAVLILALLNLLRDMHRPMDPHAAGLDKVLKHAAQYSVPVAAERTGIPEETIRNLAGRIRKSRGTAFHLSVGVNQSGFGTLTYVLLQALIYLTGNFDRAGGSLVHPLSTVFADFSKLARIGTRTAYSRIGNYPSTLDTLPGGILADEILTPGEGQIRALIVIAGDPLRSMPDAERLRKAFRSLEHLVVIDMFASETAKEADMFLPATSWLERFDFATTTMSFQHAGILQYAGAVLPPPGETRNEAWILASLARAIGGKTGLLMRPFGWLAKMESMRALEKVAALVAGAGRPFGGRTVYGLAVPQPKPGTYLGRGPRTADKRLRFHQDDLEPEFARLLQTMAPAVTDGSFLLLGRRRRLGHNGWLQGALPDGDPEAVAWLHPADAAALAIPQEGGLLRISNANGQLEIRAVARDGVARGTVVVPHGIPAINFNSLVPTGEAAIERLSGMHKMTGIAVTLATASLR